MVPIAICSVLAVTLFLERMWATRRSAVSPTSLQLNVESLLARNLFSQALDLCRGTPSALGRVLASGIRLFATETKRPVGRDELKDALEAAGRREAENLQRFVGGLSTIATLSPLLGLLGTVWGMVKTFQQIELADTISKTTMAGGIWVALLTTVAGLVVAIPTVIAHRIVSARLSDRVSELEAGAERSAELLMRPETALAGGPGDLGSDAESDAPDTAAAEA